MSASRGAPDARLGFTVLEALVGLLLGWLLLGLVLATLAAQRRAQEALARRADVLAAVRTARHVLGVEVRASVASGSVPAVGEDSMALRSVRGWGPACLASPGSSAVWVRPQGTRGPEEGGDSVAVFSESGVPVTRLLLSREPSARSCAGGAGAGWERWQLSGALPAGAVYVAYFRRGAYHLSGGALRYRAGESGRQPLTPEALDPTGTGFSSAPWGVVASLVPPGEEAWRVALPTWGPGG